MTEELFLPLFESADEPEAVTTHPCRLCGTVSPGGNWVLADGPACDELALDGQCAPVAELEARDA